MARFCQCRKGLYNECVPYRIATPPEPEPPGEEEAYLQELARRQRRSRFVGIAGAVGLVVGLGYCASRPTRAASPPKEASPAAVAAREAKAQAAIAQARDNAYAVQETFNRVMKVAIAQPLGALAEPCPVALPAATPFARRSVPLLIAEETDRSLPSQMVAEVLHDVDRAEQHLASYSFETATLYANALASPDRFRKEIVVVARSFTRPKASSPSAFDRGKLEGRVFLYDFAQAKVVCSGAITVTSSRQIGFTYSPAGDAPAAVGREGSLAHAVDEDMELQIAKAAREALRAQAD